MSSYMKASLSGPNGTGKSGTTARLLVGISKELCNSAPVVVYSSDDRWRIYKRTIFDVEKVPLTVISGESLTQVQEALTLAEKGCCALGADDLTVPWKEGLSEFSYSDGFLPFERREQLMNEWRPILRGFRLGNFHAIGVGRIGFEWSKQEDEQGRLQLTQGNSKFNAGGGENFGYEADLELEMSRNRRKIRQLLRARIQPEYICDVIKDATAGLLNGEQFIFEAKKGMYAVGDYKPVFQAFRSYINFMAQIDAPAPQPSNTRDLIVFGKTPRAQDQAARKGYLEELSNLLDHCFPGGEKRSKIDAMYKNLTLEYLNGFSSVSRMEEEVSTINLKRNVEIVKALRTRMDQGEKITNNASHTALMHLASEDVLKPGHGVTLLELMTAQSLAAVQPKGPQPVVPLMDRYPDRELTGD
jgi:hypothetical protein